jgi:hypothetical protein
LGVTVSATSRRRVTAGLGAWSDAEIRQRSRRASPDGAKLKPPMAFSLYATMTDQDLSAIVAYLRTVPPKD